jgi:DNA-binding transcriptional LysR family regulator
VAFDRDIPTRKLIDRALRQRRVQVDYVMELDNIETIKRCVEAGLGISVLPRAALENEMRMKTLVARKLGASLPRRPIGVIHKNRPELSPAAREFVARLQTELPAAR